MIKDKHKTKVVFRKFPEGDVIALMPEDDSASEGWIMSYQHIGQHGDAHPDCLIDLELATPSEYADLKKELESIGYNLKVSKK